nr:hypothetical protein [Tanacetum cinerariifolium]
MSLDDLYNHLKVYESEVQKKSESNSQNMAFISSAKHSSGNEEVNTASVSTASTNVSTASANIRAASISQDTACAYIASQSSGSQIKFEDINQIDEDDMEEMDIKWNMALLSMRADRFWKKIGKKITIQRTDMAGFDKSKVECFNCHKMGHFARECRAPRSQDRGRRDNYRQGSKVEEHDPKALMAIDKVGWNWSYMTNDEENHALVANEEAPIEFALMAKTSAESEVFDDSLCFKAWLSQVEARLAEFRDQEVKNYEKIRVLEFKVESRANCIESITKELKLIKKEKEGLDSKLAGFQTASKDLDNLLESQRSDKNKEGLGYSAVPLLLKPSPAVESATNDLQNRDPSVTKTGASPSTIISKPFIKFVKAADRPTENKTDKGKTIKKHVVMLGVKMGRTSPKNNYTHKGNISYLSDYEPFDEGYVSFGQGGCKITGRDFKLIDDTNVLLRTPRQHNMYSIDLNNIVPHKDLTCLVAKASTDECMLCHRRLGHLNFKTTNRLVRHNLVRGLPSKCFENVHTCTACLKGKQHKASSRTMLADAKLPVTFWAEAVNTACYVQNRVLVNKYQNKTPYELFNGRTPAIGFLKPFGCHVMILNTLDNLGKFKAKGDEGYFISQPQDACNTDEPESSGNSNLTATSTNPPADQLETLTVETLIPTVNSPVPTTFLNDSPKPSSDTRLISKRVTNQKETPSLDNILTLLNRFEDILRVTTNSVDSDGVEADVSNMETTITASPTPTLRIYKDHPKSQIIGPVDTPIQTRNKSKNMEEQSFITIIHQKTNPSLLQFCLFLCFLSQVEPKKISDALQDPSWKQSQASGSRAYTGRGNDCDEVFASVARIEAIRLFLAYASFMGFTVYQMDVKSAFLYGTINEKVYVMQPSGFQDLEFPARMYKIEKAMYGLHQAPRAWYGILSKYLLTNGFQRGTIDQTFFIKRKRGNFILVQVYVDDIIFGSPNPQLCREFEALMHEKFQMSVMGELNFFLGLSANTLMDKENPWGKDGTGKDVDLHLYRSMIRSLMYLTTSRPDIMFVVCACARHQVTPKECHLHAVKRIFKYLKGHPKLGLWYPKESPFDLVAYSDSNYGGATQDRKSTTEGCQFLGRRLILWQCKKQTIVATSTTEAEYVAAASGCGPVL